MFSTLATPQGDEGCSDGAGGGGRHQVQARAHQRHHLRGVRLQRGLGIRPGELSLVESCGAHLSLVQGIKYSFGLELRDIGHHGFLLPQVRALHTVQIQCRYSADTVQIQCRYSALHTVQISQMEQGTIRGRVGQCLLCCDG